METEFFEFHWQVAKQGYQLESFPDKKNPKGEAKFFLFNACPIGTTPTVRAYQPATEYPELFHTFAHIDVTKRESVLAFANQYGLLENGSGIVILPNRQPAQEGEPLSLWDEEIRAMRFAVDFWEIVRKPNREALAHMIHWDGKDSVWFKSDEKSDEIASRTKYPVLLEWFQPGKVVLPARYYLAHFINAHLSGRVTTRLLWTLSDRWTLSERGTQSQ